MQPVTASLHAAPHLNPHPIFDVFFDSVGRIVQASPEKEIPSTIAALLPTLLQVPHLLTDEQCAAPLDGYGRHKVFICPEDLFSVIAMVWPAGVVSPVHDHRTWCAFGVYEGLLEETRYLPADAAPRCTSARPTATLIHTHGDIAHLPVGESNIHRMRNPTASATVTIHVYGGNCEAQGPNLDKVYTVEG